jgi:hypothetical protein
VGRSGEKLHHDTLRVNKFLRHLLQHGFDLLLQHAQLHRTSLSSENHGFVEVYLGDRLLMYHHDVQHTRNLSRIDSINQEMLEEVLDMFRYYKAQREQEAAEKEEEDSEEKQEKRFLRHTFSSL